MKDFAVSDNPRVQAQLDRLGALTLPSGRLGLEVIHELLARLGDPHKALPPVFHVAGTNGKGSTCAYLRAMLEAEGYTVHAATKPHLVRYNERIRVAGELISDDLLADLLQEVLDKGEDLSPSFFEVTTAATFLAFHRVPADVCVIEVGLGGRFDATNVLDDQAACGIATLGIDHEAFLLVPEEGVPQEPLARIAFEKAGIARRGVPLVTMNYPPEAEAAIAAHAAKVGAVVLGRNKAWSVKPTGRSISYVDDFGRLSLPASPLLGFHQASNVGLAVAMLRHQKAIKVSDESFAKGILATRWPARLQLLGDGPLTRIAPGRRIWLDGGHNVDAGIAIANFFDPAYVVYGVGGLPKGPRTVVVPNPPNISAPIINTKIHLITGMLSSKDPAAIVAPLKGKLLSLSVVPAPGHEAHSPEEIARHADLPVQPFPDVTAALKALPEHGDVLIAGSLYLAGEVLRLNQEFPD